MNKVIKAMTLMAMVSCASVAVAQDKALATVCKNQTVYVDMGRIFTEYHVTITKNEEFKLKKLVADEQAKVKAAALQKKKQSAETFARAAQSESDTTKKAAFTQAAREEALGAAREELELKDYIEKESKKLTQEFADLRNELVAELQKYIDQFADKNKVNAIIDISGKSSNNLPVYVYYDKSKDVTEAVLAIINEGHEAEVKKALEAQKAAAESSTGSDMNKLAEEAAKAIREGNK